jgi:hypothetical protein
MLLRDHPLICHRGIPSWPPTWTWTVGLENRHPKGEVGILKAIFPCKLQPPDRCFLLISYQESEYLGCLLVDDFAFCSQITKLLQDYRNHSIVEIGGLDLSHTF